MLFPKFWNMSKISPKCIESRPQSPLCSKKGQWEVQFQRLEGIIIAPRISGPKPTGNPTWMFVLGKSSGWVINTLNLINWKRLGWDQLKGIKKAKKLFKDISITVSLLSASPQNKLWSSSLMAGVSVACFAYCLNAFSSVSHDQSNEAASLFGRVKQQFVYFWAFLQ